MNFRNAECPELPLFPEREGNEIAIFACGLFWGPQLCFAQMKGVARCVVGYLGGIAKGPTYHNIQDYTEALLVEFNPSKVTYNNLVVSWMQMHHPSYRNKTQYRSAVWYMCDDHQEDAEKAIRGWEGVLKEKLYTSVEPALSFYKAEEYHHFFLQKRAPATKWT